MEQSRVRANVDEKSPNVAGASRTARAHHLLSEKNQQEWSHVACVTTA
jgi:hypothetical protein